MIEFATGQELIDEGIIDPDGVEVFDRRDILGRSVRACNDFADGDIVCSYGGKAYKKNSAFAAFSTSLYRVDFDDVLEVDGHPSYPETKNHVGSFINDAKGPISIPGKRNNVYLRPQSLQINGVNKYAILLLANGPIDIGEELFLDYGNYWDAFDNNGVLIGQPFLLPLKQTARKTINRPRLDEEEEDEEEEEENE